jgi:phage repressor protein C with HTH and peptisase S24 domain
MKLSERLEEAMKYAGLNQPQLEAKSGVKQQIIHKILKEKQLTSAHVVKLAMACGVRSEWLSEEQGDMVDGFYVDDPRLKAALNDPKRVNALLLMESLPEYAVDHVIKEIVETQELIDQAGQGKGAAA